MCRLFGFRSVIPSQVHRSLVAADNALGRQSEAHPDGWGVAFYVDGAPHVTRSASHALGDALFHRVSGVVSSAASFGEDDDRTYIFAQDPAGGPNSGIMVFSSDGFTAYDEGTTFDVVGSVASYFGLIQLYVGENGSITATGTGTAEPSLVTAEETDCGLRRSVGPAALAETAPIVVMAGATFPGCTGLVISTGICGGGSGFGLAFISRRRRSASARACAIARSTCSGRRTVRRTAGWTGLGGRSTRVDSS